MKTIPFIDIRNGTLTDLLLQNRRSAIDLLNASRHVFGLASQVASYAALPAGDAMSRRWLEKTRNPYLDEIRGYAEMLKCPGVYALNLCYEWGCSSGIFRTGSGLSMLRVLDWPFPKLAEHMVVAHQQGTHGAFYNITWPGMSGIFNAVAPQRFSAALNQAPMRRSNGNVITDWVRNRVLVNRQQGLPPAHLLRQVFEQAKDYAEAKKMLTETPVAIPVIYILGGVGPTEGCIIERLETQAAIIEIGDKDRVVATNHFQTHLSGIGKGWAPREIDSSGRNRAMCAFDSMLAGRSLDWFQPPIANNMTRLAMAAGTAAGSFLLIGTEGVQPVTEIFRL